MMAKLFTMKKILLLCGMGMLFFAAAAQQTRAYLKKNEKSPVISREALAQARLDSLQILRQQKIDSALAYQLQYDSARQENERMADVRFREEQAAWKENKYREIDSAYKLQCAALSREHEQWRKIQQQREEVNKAARLNAYQDRQVNYINQCSFEKAKKINGDTSLQEADKKQQLAMLNYDRRSRIRTVAGRSKERKLERARKAKNNPEDTEAQWINDAEGYAKNSM